MKPINPKTDIVPLSEFRANVSELLKQTQQTGRPIVITQHGRGAGILLSADEYENLLDHAEYLQSINRGQAQLAAGEGVPHEQAVASFKATVKALREKQKSKRGKPRRKAS